MTMTNPSPLALGNAPFTTVIAGAVTEPKIPVAAGDSWRPVPASVLGVAPLAAVAAVTVMSLMSGASAGPARHSAALTPQTCVTTLAAGALSPAKYPWCAGD
jgi:hypothetical protein